VPFGYHVRELACHHMMAYHDRLAAAAEGDPRAEEALRSHCRRAVLELVLRRKGWATQGSNLRASRLRARPQPTRHRATVPSGHCASPSTGRPHPIPNSPHPLTCTPNPWTGRAAASESSRTAPRSPSSPDPDPDPDPNPTLTLNITLTLILALP
jgi:hypothetical protein